MPDFRRSPPPAWSQPLLDRLTPSVRNLIIAITLGYFFFVLAPVANDWMVTHLFLGPRLFRGEAWQLVTALFLHVRFTGWIFSVIGLWWVGAFVERVKGQRFFLGVFFGAGVAANIVAAAASLALYGAAGARSDGSAYALTALFVAFARIYGSRPVQIFGAFSWRADYFTGTLIGFSLLLALVNRDLAGFLAEVAAIAVALAATGPLKLSSLFPTTRSGRAKARYRVLDGGKRPPNRPN